MTAAAPRDQTTIRSVSVAAPAYNESAGIGPVVTGWLKFLRSRPELQSFEVVICNDGSRDETAEKLESVAAAEGELCVIEHARNQGAGVALATAIANTRSEWILLLDSDGQFPIEAFDLLAGAIAASGAPAAIGIRPRKLDNAFARFGSWSSGCLCNWFHRTRYRDFNSACKLVQGDLLRSLRLECRGLNYSTEITSKLIESGVPIAEVEIAHLPRTAGVSSLRRFRATRDRFLFVIYIGLRQVLLRAKVLRSREYAS